MLPRVARRYARSGGWTVKRTVSLIGLVLCLHAAPAFAASYTFDILYSGGGVAVLNAGSDDPVGTNIQPGDDFLWTISAQGDDAWHVVTGGNFFPLMAFFVLPEGSRTGDFDLSLLHNGVEVYSTSELGTGNSFVHLGTNTIILASGLIFDQMVLNYSMTTSDVTDTVIQGLLPIFGAPENSFSISYEADSVPEPGTFGMLAAGLVLLGVARRCRRERTTS
jgi:hypothetical protein